MGFLGRIAAFAIAASAVLAGAPEARAQSGVFAPDTLHGLADFRLSAADGETSWLDGGFGKTSASGSGGGMKVEPRLADAVLEWKPRFSFAVTGVLSVQAQPELHPAVDVGEAYLKLRAPPSRVGRITGRLGLFYPPVSQEHEGVGWTTPDTLSASALNSWIGEEVKVIGAEGRIEHAFGDHVLSATAAVFGWNDTSGTLLTFRGWALHEVRTGLRTEFDLPPLSAFMVRKQARETDPIFELDDRVGYYGALEWRPPAPVSFNALYYDNVGNRIAVQDLQWAWETRFLNVGVRWDVDERTKVLGQVMNGETLMGYKSPSAIWVDMGFRAAYLLASRSQGDNTLTGRVDWFETNDRTYRDIDNNDEDGWALTGAWRHSLAPHADFLAEVLHVSSRRPSRVLSGKSPKQGQTLLQAALRLSF